MKLKHIVVFLFLTNSTYSEVYDPYTRAVQEKESAINNFDFRMYYPIVEKIIKEDFAKFKEQMLKERDSDPNFKPVLKMPEAVYYPDGLNLERPRLQKQKKETGKSTRRVIEVD